MSLWGNLFKAGEVFSSGLVAQAEQFTKAASSGDIEASVEESQSLVWDPFSIIEQLGYKDKPSAITYGTLQAMVWRTPLIQNIILTRLNQVSGFSRRQQDKYETGYRIRLADKHATMSAADKKLARQIEDMFSTTGVVVNNALERVNFDTFLRAAVRDSLTYDQMCIEITRNRKGQPAAWYVVDASTIRLADTSSTTHNGDPDRIHTVQLLDNMVINQWTKDRMMFSVRNPHTSVRLYGYGVSEMEMMINAITAILWAFEYNQRFFSQGSVAKGLLNIKGTMNQTQLKAFRRHWYQMISGVENAWRSPVLNSSEGAEWIDMHPSNRDMEFSSWMDFLIKVIASCYQMDPLEVNFKYGDSGAGQRSMFESGNKQKLTDSKDKGLRPLLHFLENEFTRYIVSQINPDFVFEFVGLEKETKKEQADLNEIRLRSTHTLNELRKEQDLEPIEGGDVPLNPVFAQMESQRKQREMAEKQMAQGQSQFDEQQLSGALASDKDSEDSSEEDGDSFSQEDFDKLQDTKAPLGKSLSRKRVKLTMEV